MDLFSSSKDKLGRGLILEKLGVIPQVRQICLPKPNYGQVEIEVVSFGVCGSQIGEINGVKGADPYLPHLMGHEAFGVVADVGKGVSSVRVGDSVILHWMPGNGIDGGGGSCVSADLSAAVNFGPANCFSDRAVVSENRVTVVGDLDMPAALMPLLGCAVGTGFGVIENDVRPKRGDEVLLVGFGGVGVFQGLWLKHKCRCEVVVLDSNATARNLAQKFGFRAIETCDELLSDGLQFDVIVDNVAESNLSSSLVRCAKRECRYCFVGVPKTGTLIRVNSLAFNYGLEMFGSVGGRFNPTRDLVRYASVANAYRDELLDWINVFSGLDSVPEILSRMSVGDLSGRCIVQMY